MNKIYDITNLRLENTCVGITQKEFDAYTKNAVKANGLLIRRLIRKFLPDLWVQFGFNHVGCFNPYEHQAKRTKTHFIYVHSGIEYFLKFTK